MKKLLGALCTFLLFGIQTANADLISEFEPNPVGADPANVSFELSGTASSSFDLWILSIESDSVSSLGVVDRASNVTGTYGANGLAEVIIPDLENPSFTVVLTSGFTGSAGTTDIDTDNDGVADTLGDLGTIMDAIGVPDNGTDFVYGSQLGGQDFAYTGDEPKLVFRDGTTGGWWAINDPAGGLAFRINGNTANTSAFDMDPETTTFGSTNPSFTGVPEPSTGLVIVGLTFGLLGVRRRVK